MSALMSSGQLQRMIVAVYRKPSLDECDPFFLHTERLSISISEILLSWAKILKNSSTQKSTDGNTARRTATRKKGVGFYCIQTSFDTRTEFGVVSLAERRMGALSTYVACELALDM